MSKDRTLVLDLTDRVIDHVEPGDGLPEGAYAELRDAVSRRMERAVAHARTIAAKRAPGGEAA